MINAIKKTFEKGVFIEDWSRMFRMNFALIGDKDKNRIFHDSFDVYIHNNLSKVNGNKEGHDPFSYSEYIQKLQWEDKDKTYRFCLPQTPSILRKIGSQMNNCVGSYSEAVKSGRSIIIGVIVGGKWRICVEVSPQFKLRQALRPHNAPLKDEEREVVLDWCNHN